MFLAVIQQKISETQITPKFFQIDFLIFANYVQCSSFNFFINLIRMFGVAAYLIWPPSLRQIDYNDNLSFEFLNRKLVVFQYLSLTRPHSDLILDFFVLIEKCPLIFFILNNFHIKICFSLDYMHRPHSWQKLPHFNGIT